MRKRANKPTIIAETANLLGMDMDDEAWERAVVNRLNGELRARGLTLPAVAPMLGISYDTLRNHLLDPSANDYTQMRIRTFYRLCAILRRTPKDIMDAAEQDMNRG